MQSLHKMETQKHWVYAIYALYAIYIFIIHSLNLIALMLSDLNFLKQK